MPTKKLPRPVFRLSLPVVIALLSACGGGGGGSDSSSTTSTAPLPAPASVSTSANSTAAAPATSATDFSCGLNAPAGIQAEVLLRVNAVRAAGAVCGTTAFPATTSLNWNTTLLQAARSHSADMAANNYFSHTGRDGRSPAQRVTAAGYSFSTMGENIAAGQTSVEAVMNGWLASEGHCRNIMNASFRDVAVACVRNDAAVYKLYWTMALGRPL